MPRLKQISRADAAKSVRKYYNALFGERDPVAQPGTATGTRAIGGRYLQMCRIFLTTRPATLACLACLRIKVSVRWIRRSASLALCGPGLLRPANSFFSQHCKAARRNGVSEEKIQAIPHWQVADVYDAKERAVLAWADALILQGGRASDALFEALHAHLSDEDIFRADLPCHGIQLTRSMLQSVAFGI